MRSRTELLERFDQGVAALRTAIAATSGESFNRPWSLLAGGRTLFTYPRGAMLRGMVLNHGIHHRGQLTVYLRLNDAAVPAVYGPSADERPPM